MLLLLAACTSGCGSFHAPPLPQAASTSPALPAPALDPAWTAKLREADAVYFSLTKSAATPDHPIWQVVQLWQSSGRQVALGWAEVPVAQQPLLEQWRRREIPVAQLPAPLVRPERALFLRPDLGQAALGFSRELLGKIRDGAPLSAEEQAQIPSGFRVQPEAFEDFADRVASSPRLRRYNIRALFRAHLVAEQTIAENIVRFRHARAEVKLLIFLPNDPMIDPQEIADFAAQKMPLRQLILDRSQPLREPGPQLVDSGAASTALREF